MPRVPEPDGWFIPHHRAVGSTLYFGPFVNLDEARAFLEQHPDVRGLPYALFKTVDWNRR